MSETSTVERQALVQAVANEVRAQLARRRMSHSEAARRLGWKPAYMGRRMIGDTALDAVDLAQLAQLLDVPVTAFFPPSKGGQSSEDDYAPGILTCRYGQIEQQFDGAPSLLAA
jgi:transcriptional regulator with XRE-family HTH domain